MRNNNAMSTIDEEADDGPSEPSGRGKNKKDEEDMDEDERLLASEEGKKLSSKERRQLRNKVSARAFRSRRKGKNGLAIDFKELQANPCSQNTSLSWKVKLLQRRKNATNSSVQTAT